MARTFRSASRAARRIGRRPPRPLAAAPSPGWAASTVPEPPGDRRREQRIADATEWPEAAPVDQEMTATEQVSGMVTATGTVPTALALTQIRNGAWPASVIVGSSTATGPAAEALRDPS